MFSKLTLEKYRNRELENHDWVKQIPKEELFKDLALEFKREPFKHQLAMALLATSYDGFMFFSDMGTGKTDAVLSAVRWYKKEKKIERTLVVVPNVVNIAGWEEEVKENTTLKVIGLSGTVANRKKALEQEADLYIINYAGLQTLVAPLRAVSSKRNQRVLDKEAAAIFAKRFQFIIYDEIHKSKADNSLVAQICIILSSIIPYRIGMTGTPFGKQPEVLWNQFYLVDRGATFGINKDLFLTTYFDIKPNYFGGIDFKIKPAMKDILYEHCKHRSIRYTKLECGINLPPRTYIPVYIQLSQDARTRYKEIAKQCALIYAQTGVYARESHIQFREICSGFLYGKDAKGNRTLERFSNAQKEEALASILESVSDEDKIVIFYYFEESRSVIEQVCKKTGTSHTAMYGKDAADNYRDFKAGKYKAFLVNVMSAAGLNLQNANYMIHYEPTDKLIDHTQNKDRIYRPGQTKPVFEYQIITKNTVEEKMFESLKEGKELFEEIINGRKPFGEIL